MKVLITKTTPTFWFHNSPLSKVLGTQDRKIEKEQLFEPVQRPLLEKIGRHHTVVYGVFVCGLLLSFIRDGVLF